MSMTKSGYQGCSLNINLNQTWNPWVFQDLSGSGQVADLLSST